MTLLGGSGMVGKSEAEIRSILSNWVNHKHTRETVVSTAVRSGVGSRFLAVLCIPGARGGLKCKAEGFESA